MANARNNQMMAFAFGIPQMSAEARLRPSARVLPCGACSRSVLS